MSRTNSSIAFLQKSNSNRSSLRSWTKSSSLKSSPNLSKSQKLQQRRLCPLTLTKRGSNTTYQIQDDKDPTILETVHRNPLVECYPKGETLPPMIEEYMCLWIEVMTTFTRDSCNKEFRSQTTPNNLAWKTLSHFLFNLFVQLRLHFHRDESLKLAVTLELTLFISYHRQCQ